MLEDQLKQHGRDLKDALKKFQDMQKRIAKAAAPPKPPTIDIRSSNSMEVIVERIQSLEKGIRRIEKTQSFIIRALSSSYVSTAFALLGEPLDPPEKSRDIGFVSPP